MMYLVLDLETGIHNRGEESIGNMKAAPWHPKNKVVLAGHRGDEMSNVCVRSEAMLLRLDIYNSKVAVIVGHNIKFDLHYLMMASLTWGDEVLPNLTVWDTQLAEYIISGQRKMYPSLDYCSEKYGGTLKDDVIKDFWNNGVDTEDIPDDMLAEYLENDVRNTELVYLSQVAQATEMGMMPLMLSQMRALKATTEMEFNGMHFDKSMASSIARTIRPELHDTIDMLHEFMRLEGIEKPNYNSAAQVAAVIYGGAFIEDVTRNKLDDDGNPVVYKSGARKGELVFRKEKKTHMLSGIVADTPELTDTGKISVSDGPLSKLRDPFVINILKARGLNKDLTTYYDGYSKLVWPTVAGLGIIHHSLNHCSTGTGRLSSTNPNLQNAAGD
jgi:DNA polymerase I-like protein with 3'-5' exonuclease and polymerase domains